MGNYHASLRPAEDGSANFFQTSLQLLGKGMDGRKFWEVVAQRKGSTGGEHASLAHTTTEEFPEPTGLGNELFGANKARANGSAYR